MDTRRPRCAEADLRAARSHVRLPPPDKTRPAHIPAEIAKLAAERELCRANEQFVQSDALRKKISVLGYSIEDTPQGPFVSKI